MTKRTLAAAASGAKRARKAVAVKTEESTPAVSVKHELSQQVVDDWHTAKDFVFATHRDSYERILSRATGGLVDWPTFLKEYTYVVLASGFRARTASKLVEPILAQVHDEQEMLGLFGNRSKINAIYTMAQREHEYDEIKAQMTDVDSLEVRCSSLSSSPHPAHAGARDFFAHTF